MSLPRSLDLTFLARRLVVCSDALFIHSGFRGDVQMRKFLLTFALTLVFLVSIAPPATAAPGAIRCGQLLDVRTGRLLKDQVIVFDAEGVITAVGPTGSPMSAGGATTVDLPSATCLPGLIDVHDHLTSDPTEPVTRAWASPSHGRPSPASRTHASRCAPASRPFATSVPAGYTDVALRDGITAGEVAGPRMLVSGPRSASPAATATTICWRPSITSRTTALPMARGPRVPRCGK